jgi:hypothetical protein
MFIPSAGDRTGWADDERNVKRANLVKFAYLASKGELAAIFSWFKSLRGLRCSQQVLP